MLKNASLKNESQKSIWFFNRVAFFFKFFENHLYKQYKRILGALKLDTTLTVLDLGTGTGTLAKAWVEQGHSVTALDGSIKMLNRAQKKVPTIPLLHKDISQLSNESVNLLGTFDIVSMSYVLHGMSAPLRHHTLQIAARLTRKYVVIFDYAKKGSWFTQLIECVEGPHYFDYIQTPLEKQVNNANLEVIRFVPTGGEGGFWLCQNTS